MLSPLLPGTKGGCGRGIVYYYKVQLKTLFKTKNLGCESNYKNTKYSGR